MRALASVDTQTSSLAKHELIISLQPRLSCSHTWHRRKKVTIIEISSKVATFKVLCYSGLLNFF